MYDPLVGGKEFEKLLKERTERFTRAGKGREATFCQTNGLKRIMVSSSRKSNRRG